MSSVSQASDRLSVSLSDMDSISSLTDGSKCGVRVTRAIERDSLRLSVTAAGALFALYSPIAGAASSASFQISASTFDVAGGSSSSASHQVQSCVGSEIAGTSGSSNFRVDSGCGVALGFVANPLMIQEAAIPVPAMSATTTIFLTVILGVLALLHVRGRTVGAITSATLRP